MSYVRFARSSKRQLLKDDSSSSRIGSGEVSGIHPSVALLKTVMALLLHRRGLVIFLKPPIAVLPDTLLLDRYPRTLPPLALLFVV